MDDRQVRQAAAAAGRDPDRVRICVAAPAYVGENLQHLRDQVRWFGGMVGNHVADIVARYGAGSESVPAVLTDYIAARTGYDYNEHGKAREHAHRIRPRRDHRPLLHSRPRPNHVERLQELREIGAANFSVYLMHDAPDATLDAYAKHVIGSV